MLYILWIFVAFNIFSFIGLIGHEVSVQHRYKKEIPDENGHPIS